MLRRSLRRAAAVTVALVAVGEPLWAAAVPSFEKEGRVSGLMVSSLAFSADGRVLAAAGGEGSVDTRTGRVLLSTSGGIVLIDAGNLKPGKRVATGSWPGSLTFSADGTELFGVIDGELRRWRAKDGRPLATLAKGVETVAYAVDGTRAALALTGGGYSVLELPSGRTVATHPAADGVENGQLLLAATAPLLAHVKDGELRLRALGSSDDVSAGAWTEGGISAAAVAPGAKIAALGTDSGAVVLVDLAARQRLRANAVGKARVNAIAFAPDGSAVVYGGVNAALNLWNLESDEVEVSFGQHRFPILAVAFAANGRRLATSSFDSTIKLWEVSFSGEAELISKPE